MRQHLQVLPTANKSLAPLPALFTANDVRGLVHYLKKKPEGVTLGEAMTAMKKQVFEPRKFDAYQSLGIIVSEKDRFKLSQIGWELARRMEPEVVGFRQLLNHISAYRSVLAWADEKKLEILLHQDVAVYWRDHHREALGVSTEKIIEGAANSFFQLCQAAGLGTHIVGKKGQPTRLRLETDELRAFVLAEPTRWPREISAAETGNGADDVLDHDGAGIAGHYLFAPPRPAKRPGVFLSFSSRGATVAKQIQTILDLAELTFEKVERGEFDLLQTPRTADAIRSSDVGLLIIGADDYEKNPAGELMLRQCVQFEIVAASVVFDNQLLLLWEQSLPRPVKFEHLNHICYERETLTWELGVRLIRELKHLATVKTKKIGPEP